VAVIVGATSCYQENRPHVIPLVRRALMIGQRADSRFDATLPQEQAGDPEC
jgi:hypothetical protein